MPKRRRKSAEQTNKEQKKSMKRRRENESSRIAEQCANTAAHQRARDNIQRRTAEQASNTASRRQARRNTERLNADKLSNAASLRSTRKIKERREAEQKSNTKARRSARENEERREAEQASNTTARRSARQNKERRVAEQASNTTSRHRARQNKERREAEQASNTTARRIARQNKERREAEQASNTTAKRSARQNKERQEAEQALNTTARRSARQNKERREAEQASNTTARRSARQNKERREAEQASNTTARRSARQNKERRDDEQTFNTAAHQDRRNRSISNFEKLLSKYLNQIRHSPSFICSCCGGLWYEESTWIVSESVLAALGLSNDLIARILYVNQDCHRLCATCKKSVVRKPKACVPKLALCNGFDFPILPEELQGLSRLEERLVAPRLPFMQIRLLGCERQSILRGNVVNVENNLDKCALVLPRKFDETSTVQVKLMRRMTYQVPYIYETIRPYKVFQAAKYLITTDLYVSENLSLSDDWKLSDQDSTLNFICNPSDAPTSADNTDTDQNINVDKPFNQIQTLEDVSSMGSDETLIFRDDDLDCYGFKVAPAEDNIPVPLHRDFNAEELSFPSIYGGVSRKFKDSLKVSYTDIAKSELRRYDRRACRPEKILYSFKRSFNEKVFQAIQVCMRQRKGSEKITAGKLRRPGFIQNLFTQDKGYPIFKHIRSSPMYWKDKTKKVLAMIRQLGKCTFFITLSAAETKWTELLVMLMKVVKNQTITETEASELQFQQVAELIRSDPVTCMRHFDHKYRALLNLLFKKEYGIFAPYKLQDHFSRLEFQMRGSPHSHGLYWIKNAPVYVDSDPQSWKQCITFIDSFITCERCEEGEMKQLIGYQLHQHSHTCKKKLKGKRKCRFQFPKPPMEETRILTPIPETISREERKSAEDLYAKVQEKLNELGRDFHEDIDYDFFLESLLQTTHMDYIFAIRSSIRRPTIFLKRSTNAIFINPYNRQLLEAWRANIDFQFVLDTYACAKYCVGYILKSEGGVSKLLRAVAKDARHGNEEVREKLRKVGSILINGSEISAQEASAFLLGIRNTECSRQDVYINTSPPDERIGILKTKLELDELEDDNEDVCSKGIVDHYAVRPIELEKICLAEFASMYEFSRSRKKTIDNESEEDEEHESFPSGHLRSKQLDTEGPLRSCEGNKKSQSMSLMDFSGTIRQRNVRKVIRFRHYGKGEDPENYNREQLMLFLPWRNERTELLTINCTEKVHSYEDEIKENSRPYYWDNDVHDDFLNIIRDLEQINEDEEDQDETVVQNQTIDEEVGFEGNELDDLEKKSSRIEKFLKPRMVNEEDYLKLMQELNDRQRRFVLNTMFTLKTNKTPFYNFLSGGAGVGKSHTLTAIVQSYLRYYDKFPNHNPEKVCVLVSAPTGKAAFNVFGMTLHCTFKLPPTQYRGKVGSLDDSSLNTLRIRLEGVNLFIIDEISMVSVIQLYDIDQRLRQIYATNKDFGGKSLVVIGHLRQLPPVAAPHVFTIPSHLALGECIGNHLWSNFKLYELTEVMRQKGEFEFCKALNNMAEGCMDADDIALIKSRQINVDITPPDEAIRLFKTNRECQDYNSEVHDRLQTDGCTSMANDQIQGKGTMAEKTKLLEYAMTLTPQQSDGLPYKTHLQVGGEYFISTNVDVQDGLFNGSTGTLKLIEYGKSFEKTPNRAWVDFHNTLIGISKRSSMKWYQEKRKNIHVDWVPIGFEKRNLSKTGQHRGLQIIRRQIPLVAANGMTINKSQGSSLLLVVVCVQEYVKVNERKTLLPHISKRRKKWLSRELLYVGCSRSTSLNGLYIDGNFEPPLPPGPEDLVSKEMARLRTIPFEFSIRFLQDVDEEFEKLYFHNIQSFRAHKKDILSDHCAMASNILAFVEPWLLSFDEINVPNYTLVHRTNCRRTIRNSEGALLLSRIDLCKPEGFSVYVDFEATGHLIVLQFKVYEINCIMLYKSPHYSKSKFLTTLEDNLTTVTGKLVVFGDANMDLQKPEGQSVLQIFHNKHLESKLPLDCPSTDYGTTIDLCFSNVLEVEAWYYESYYSHHKAICVIWPKAINKT